MSHLRQTRSKSRELITETKITEHEQVETPQIIYPKFRDTEYTVANLPDPLQIRDTKLSKHDQKTLIRKQQWLQQNTVSLPKPFARHRTSIDATLVFAQEEAGTAVCISPDGMILTCSHCIAESSEDLDQTRTYWLLSCSGQAIAAKCVAWDSRRDLAILRVAAAQHFTHGTTFPFAPIATETPHVGSRVVCAGHPGSEDLEASQPGIATDYDVLHVSVGTYHGTAAGQDVQDNSDIGALMHDAWTYWGHSGAPLFSVKSGCVVGLHSSWDDTTGMRRGVSLEAIQAFLAENVKL